MANAETSANGKRRDNSKSGVSRKVAENDEKANSQKGETGRLQRARKEQGLRMGYKQEN